MEGKTQHKHRFSRRHGRPHSIFVRLAFALSFMGLVIISLFFIVFPLLLRPMREPGQPPPWVSHHNHFMLLSGSVLVGIFFLAYRYIRKQLYPLIELRQAAQRLGEGELDVAVPVRHRNELGQLATVFNQMARQIEEMVTSRDRLLLDVSHELRTPITRMRLGLEFIPPGPERNSLAEDLDDLELLVSTLLEGERLRKGMGQLETEAVDSAALASEVLAHYQNREIPVELAPVPELPHLMADRLRLKLVMQNLLDNACKYSLPGSGPAVLSLGTEGQHLFFAVTDNGPGVPPNLLPEIFKPFVRADEARAKQGEGPGGLWPGAFFVQGHC